MMFLLLGKFSEYCHVVNDVLISKDSRDKLISLIIKLQQSQEQ